MLKRLLIIAIIAITGFSSAYSLESLRIAGHSAGFTGEQNVSVVCYNAVGTAVSASPLNYDVLFTTGGIFSFIWHDPSVIYNPAHFVSLKIGTTVFYTRRLDKIMDAQSLYGDLIDPDEIDLTQPFAFMSDVDVYGIFTIHGEGENAGDVDNFIILDPNTGDISGRTLHIGLNRTEFVVDENGNLDMDGTLDVDGAAVFAGNVAALSFTQNGHAVIDVTTSLLGDVTGPISETVVGDDSHNHTATTLPETTSFLGADIDLASAEVTGVLANANVAEDLTIVGGTIDNTIIGGTTPAEGTFTKLTSTYIGTPGYLPGNAGIRMSESDGSGWLNIRADAKLLFQLGRSETGEDLGLVFNSQADGKNRAGLGWDGSSWTVSVGELALGEVIGFNYLDNTTDARRLTIVADGETTFNVDREGDVTANEYMTETAAFRVAEDVNGTPWVNMKKGANKIMEIGIGTGMQGAPAGYGMNFNNDAGNFRAGMGYQNGSWAVGVGDLSNGAMLAWAGNNTDEVRIVVLNEEAEAPVFVVDAEGDVIANSYMQGNHAVVDMNTPLVGDVTGTVGANEVRDDSHYHTYLTLPAATTYLGSDIDLNSDEITGILAIVNGGTGANNAADARTNLGLANVVYNTDIPHANGDVSGTYAAGLTLDDDAVTSSKIFSGAVTGIKIAQNAVGPYAISSSGVTAESYGYATHVPQIYVDEDGRITTAANVEIMISLGGQTTGAYVVSLENSGGLSVFDTDEGGDYAENDGKNLTVELNMAHSNHWTASQQFNTVDINGGTIDGTNIGVSATGSGKFSTLTATGATVLEGTVDIQGDISNSTGDVTVDDNLKLNDKFIVAIINKTVGDGVDPNTVEVDFDSESGTFLKITSDGDDSTDVLTIDNPVTGQVLYIHYKNDDGYEWLNITNGPSNIIPGTGITIIYDGSEWLDVSSFNPD